MPATTPHGTEIGTALAYSDSPPYVAGIDSALARTGVAIIELIGDSCRARTSVVATALTEDSIPGQYQRIESVVNGVDVFIPRRPAELALIEAPALEASGGNPLERAAVWYGIVGVLIHRGTPLAKVAPTTLKKWVTGRGGSVKNPVEKRHIVAAMHTMWPGLPCTASELRHHECESLGLAHMAAQHLGWPVPVQRHHAVSLAVVKWPP